MSLTINDVRRISDLARIDLSEESAKKLMGELNDILSMVEQIQSVDTTGAVSYTHLKSSVATKSTNPTIYAGTARFLVHLSGIVAKSIIAAPAAARLRI